MASRLRVVAAVAGVCGMGAAALPAEAQDAQYWGHAYGTRAQLLGGSTVGGVLDLSSTFYNPGATALTSESNLVLGGGSILWSRLSLEGQQSDQSIGSDQLSTAPSLFALKFQQPGGTGAAFSFCYLTRADVDLELRAVAADPYSADPAVTRLAGEAVLQRQLSESWGGIGWSKPAGEFGVGAQLFVAHRNEQVRGDFLVQEVKDDTLGTVATVSDTRFYHTRALLKLGIAYRGSRTTAGLAVTTPGLKILSSGEVFADASVTNVDVDGDGDRDQLLSGSAQEELDVRYKSPASVAIGGSQGFDRFRLHLAAEWFAGIPEYDLIEADSLVSQTTGGTAPLYYRTASRSIVNFGLGFEWRVGETGALFAAARTDNSTFVYVPESQYTSYSSWDIGHSSLGGAFRVSALDFTVGAGYSFGAGSVRDANRLADEGGETSAIANRDLTTKYQGLTGIVGFGLPF